MADGRLPERSRSAWRSGAQPLRVIRVLRPVLSVQLRQVASAFQYVWLRFANDRRFAAALVGVTVLAAAAVAFDGNAQIAVAIVLLGCLAIAMEFG
jgi:hypothetical protein